MAAGTGPARISTLTASTDTAADRPTFVDTNVLLYAHDASESVKRPVAAGLLARLWRDRTGVLSTQVLQEFYVAGTRRLRPPIPRSSAREIIEQYRAWPVVTIEPTMILAASVLQEQHHLSFWDALVIQAAAAAGAGTLLTEDLQHGSTYLGVTIIDPFRVE